VERLFALADLHLSTTGEKPMDVFSPLWKHHARRMAEAWDDRVGDEDTVLLPGDLSWAKTLPEAALDLAWIEARRGFKVLLRGNHDSWWTSVSKVRAALSRRCFALQHDAVLRAGRVIVGARGWTDPTDPSAKAEDAAVHRRELERLRLSVRFANERFGRDAPRVAMVHYPPWIAGREPTEVVAILAAAGVRDCVFGHLHGADHALAVTGEQRGIRFHLVAADAVEFAPVLIP